VKEPCLLVPSHQSSDASGQFGLDFQGPKSFERNLKLLNFSPMDTQVCPYTDLQTDLGKVSRHQHQNMYIYELRLAISRPMARQFGFKIPQARPPQSFVQINLGHNHGSPFLGVNEFIARVIINGGEHPLA